MRFIATAIFLALVVSCVRNREKTAPQVDTLQQEYLQKGGEIAALTQSELLKNVAHALSIDGPGYAIDFCSLRAMQLVDSLSRLKECRISRISDRYRNPADRPQTETEKEQLKLYRAAHVKGEPAEPAVYYFDDRVEYYQPIFIDRGACLMCHGTPGSQISEPTLAKINARYPDDRATGYALNDFRGAWKITFEK